MYYKRAAEVEVDDITREKSIEIAKTRDDSNTKKEEQGNGDDKFSV